MIFLLKNLCFYREKNDVRSVAARGDVYVVNASWLQDCCREKTLLPVLPHHNAYNLLFPNGVI